MIQIQIVTYWVNIMLKKILSVLGFLVILILGKISGEFGKNIAESVSSPAKPSTQQIETSLINGLTTVAQQLNQQLPMMIDKDTRGDRVSVGPGARLTYHYTFPNFTSRDVDQISIQAYMREEVKKNLCANEKMKSSIQYGAIYGYTFVGSDNVEIVRFEIDRNDCGFVNVQAEQNIQKATPSSANSAEDMFQRANDLYSQGRYAEALPLYQQLARYSGAQISLGGMYESGNGVTKNYNQAVYWYRKAAEKGDINQEIAKEALSKLISKEKNEILKAPVVKQADETIRVEAASPTQKVTKTTMETSPEGVSTLTLPDGGYVKGNRQRIGEQISKSKLSTGDYYGRREQ